MPFVSLTRVELASTMPATAATLLLADGVDTRTVMDLLEQSERRAAPRYALDIDRMRREATTADSWGALRIGQLRG